MLSWDIIYNDAISLEKQFSNMNQKSFKKYIHFGTSLMAQWLRLPAPKTQGMGSTPSGELRFCMLYSMIKKKKKGRPLTH